MDEVAQLEEQLLCEQVMLRSLDDLGADRDDDRADLRASITRIKKLLERARRGEPAVEVNEEEKEDDDDIDDVDDNDDLDG